MSETSGGDFVRCQEAPVAPVAEDQTAARRLWEATERYVGLA